MSIGKINLFLLKLLNLFLALHQKRRTTIPSFLFARTKKGRCDCIASSFFLKTMIRGGRPPIHRNPGLLAGGADAPYKRFGLWPKPWRRQNSLLPSTVIAGGERRQSRRNPKQKAVAYATAFCFGGDNRTRICDLPRVRRTLYRLSYASILNG